MVKPLKRSSSIRLHTGDTTKAELVFVSGPKPYIHFFAGGLCSGFVPSKDVKKLKRMVASL